MADNMLKHSSGALAGDLASMIPLNQVKRGDPITCPQGQTECHALREQHGLRIREMRQRELEADMACHARRGRTARAGFLNNYQGKMESTRLSFLDYSNARATELHAQETKHVKSLTAVPKVLDTPLVWQQQFAAEHDLPKPDRLTDRSSVLQRSTE